MSKDIKGLLKEAREAIKIKDFQTSIKLCKTILKEDKDNYMGLVFFGLSAQEIGAVPEQAVAAFKKATKLNSENILAWNGLMNYYEKSQNNSVELENVYIKLLALETNEKKIQEICEKLIELLSKNEFSSNVIEVLMEIIKGEKYSQNMRLNLAQLFADFCTKQSELNDELSQIFEELLRILINETKTITNAYYLNYLQIIHKHKKVDLLFDEARIMYEKLENPIALEWICKLHNEFYIEEKPIPTNIINKIDEYCEILLNKDSSSHMAQFTKALILYKNNNIIEAKNLLLEVLENRPGLMHAWYLISKCYENLEIYNKALDSINKANKLLQSINNSNDKMRLLIDHLELVILSNQTNKKELKLAEEKAKHLLELNPNCVEYRKILIKIYINLQDYVEAKKMLMTMKSVENIDLLEVHMFIQKQQLQEAMQMLELIELKDYEYFKTLGILCWKLEEFENSFVPLIKAVKLKPCSYICFLHLGHYYKNVNNVDKARRCYEKAFNINMDCIEAGIELTKIYRNDKNWEANLSLLENLTQNKVNVWAYLQLGLHYMEQENYTKAIDSLRYVIRLQPNNSHFWESLGDAYFLRGSYTSALKSYNQAVELAKDNLYPQLQIANIKLLLQEYPEARRDFETILSQNRKYLPALKGIAETCLRQAEIYQKNQLFGLSRDCLQCALDNITISLQERPEISCLWKIAADSCYLITKLPDRYCCVLVSMALTDDVKGGNKALERENLFILATRCYCRAINIVKENILLWHDLGVCYLSHAQSTENIEIVNNLYEKSLACAMYCVENNSQYWPHWNLLGNIVFHQKPKNYALVQHAFIKAITLEQNNPIAWCNLGTFYLHLEQIQLANKAFSQAQRSDPNYVNSWIGQALIAEFMGHEDAMDLFRHSTQLSVHPESSIGYGHWVCQTLLQIPSDKIIYSIHNMHAVSVAHDCLTWYTENNPDDACAWNMLGILSERIGLKITASSAFKRATLFCENNNRDQAKINYGRLLMKLGRYSESVDIYKNIKEATFNSVSGLALALFKDQQYEESYQTYKSALNWLTEEQIYQSDLLVALASMALLFQGPEQAKPLLLQSTQLKPPSPWALYATLSLGLLYKDINLAMLVLKELKNLESNKQCLPHYATLLSYTYLLQGENKKALIELSRLTHKYPDQASLWYQLSHLLIRLSDLTKFSAAAKCAQATMILGRNNMDVTKVLCLVSLACYLSGDYKKSLNYAQKAIHCYPDVAETWTVLIYSLDYFKKQNKFLYDPKKVAKFVTSNMQPSNAVNDWLASYC